MRRTIHAAAAGVVAAAGLLVLAPVGPASAHTDLLSTWPASGEPVQDPVTLVRLDFASVVVPDLTSVAVRGGDEDWVSGNPQVNGGVVAVPVSPLRASGAYEIGYRTVAADGHPVTGSVTIHVSAASARAARQGGVSPADQTTLNGEESEAGQTVTTGGSWDVATTAVGGGALAVVLGVGLLRRRRTPDLNGAS